MKLLYLIALIPLIAAAQEFDFQFQPDAFPVAMEEGWIPFSPWAGGVSESGVDFCDIDNDGDWDAFIGNVTGKIVYYVNIGSPIEPEFQFVTSEYANINVTITVGGRSGPKFCDIDNDGDYDFFSSCGYGLVHFWENQGTPENALFVHITDSLENIDVPGTAHLDLVDIDADGDYDLMLGDCQGRIHYYENVGTPYSMDFELVTAQFDSIDLPGYHAGPRFVDIDSDNDYDLFIGDYYGHIWYYHNNGDSINYDFTYISNHFGGIDVGDFAVPEFADIDNDGDFDMFIGREGNYNIPYGDVWYYENVGTPETPAFEFITKNYFTFDISYHSTIPQFIDINNDGLQDMLIGTARTIHYFQNIGTETEPYFTFINDNFQGIYRQESHPFFVDIDADGDYDLLLGETGIPNPPSLALYINRGTPEVPNLRLEDENYITNPDFFANLQPSCADIDADGDYDLFLTDDDGHYFYYQNNGSPQAANFVYVTSQWQGIQTFYPYDIWKYMCFGDIDNDGDLDLLLRGNLYYDNILFYRNEGSPQSANMVLESEEFLPGFILTCSVPSLIDIDGDGDMDLFVGDEDGGVMFFRNFDNPYQVQLTVSISGNDVILTWQTIPGALEYRVYYSDDPYFMPSGIPQAVALPPDTSFIDVGAAGVWGQRFYRVVVEY